MPAAYMALGHGSEAIIPRCEQGVVPPGCTLVLAEECGMSAVLPAHIYKSITTSSYAEYFDNPIKHKEVLESIFRRPLRIYTEGKRMPNLSITFLSSFPDTDSHIEPSGLIPIPIAESVLLKDATAIGEERYYTSTEKAYKAFAGAVYPEDVKGLKLSAIRKMKDIETTQLEMFKEFPGVHYNLLCRSVHKDEDELKRLIIAAAPQINPCYAADLFGTVDDWLGTEAATTANPKAVARMREIVSQVIGRRRSSGEPLGAPAFNRVVNLILAKRTPTPILERAISELTATELQGLERRDGYTLLGVAASVGNPEAIRMLLAAGALLNGRDVSGRTALMVALQHERVDVATVLIDEGTDIGLVDENGWTALMHACTSEETGFLIIRLITETNINHADKGGDTALNIAAGYPFPNTVRMLLSAGAHINTKNMSGDTPLMTACASGYAEIAEVLIKAGAEVNHRNATKYSALSYAIRARMDTIATMLIEAGARTKSWLAVVEVAKRHGMPLTEAAAIAARAAGRSENRA